MKLAVSSMGSDLNALVSPVFGRCAWFVYVDSVTNEYSAVANAAASASGGAGIQAAQGVVAAGAQAVLTGNVGPNAMQVLQAGEVKVYQVTSGTVGQAVEAFVGGTLTEVNAATTAADYGKGLDAAQTPSATRPGMGLGRGMGAGRGRGGGGRGGAGGGGRRG